LVLGFIDALQVRCGALMTNPPFGPISPDFDP
jgi:hypothetical protein